MLKRIPIKQIVLAQNDRPEITEGSVMELKDSIAAIGILQAPVVRPVEGKENQYELVAGYRRHHCAMLLEWSEIDCTVKELTDTEARVVRLTENLQRKDLHPLDESKAYRELVELGNSPNQIAMKIGKAANHVEQFIKLEALSSKVAKEFRAGTLELGHAKVLMVLPALEQNQALDSIKAHFGNFSYFETPYALLKYINRSVKRSLVDAPFDTERKKGFGKLTACTGCPFNSSTAPGLFNSIEGDSVCTKPSCYDKKSEIVREENKQALLLKYDAKEEDLQTVHERSWDDYNTLGTGSYRPAKPTDTNTTLVAKKVRHGIESGTELIEVVITKKTPKSEVKEETKEIVIQKPHEEFKGRRDRRRAKQLNVDTHTARAAMVETMAKDPRKELTDWEMHQMFIDYVVRVEHQYTIKQMLGIEGGVYSMSPYEFEAAVHKLPLSTLFLCVRHLMAYKHIRAEDKVISELPLAKDTFKQHALNLGVNYDELVAAEFAKRQDNHNEEDAKLAHMEAHAAKKDERAMDYIAQAPEEDPILVKIMKAKKPATVIKKQEPDYLATLSRKLGSKTKKEATAEWYADYLPVRLKELHAQIEALKATEVQEVDGASPDDLGSSDVIDLGIPAKEPAEVTV
jgi:ParB/RepB/Spo0J family partition protein